MAESMFIIPEFPNTILQTLAVLVVLWYFLGAATLAAIATLMIVSPMTILVARRYRKLDHVIMGAPR
ncbi:MAG: hypothetical protein IPF59_14335 [Ignavibacteria bacterium]|nr:hypothetical protein [Ignavibacteria bacterium]